MKLKPLLHIAMTVCMFFINIASSTALPPGPGTTSPSILPAISSTPAQGQSFTECLNELDGCILKYVEMSSKVQGAENVCKAIDELYKCYLETENCDRNLNYNELIPGIQSILGDLGRPCNGSTALSPPSAKSTTRPSGSVTHFLTGVPTTPARVISQEECISEINHCNDKLMLATSNVESDGEMCKAVHELYDCLTEAHSCDGNFIKNEFIPDVDSRIKDVGLACAPWASSSSKAPYINNTACAAGLDVCEGLLFSANVSDPKFDFCQLVSEYVNCIYAVRECDPSFIRTVTLPRIKATYEDLGYKCNVSALDGINSPPGENACLTKYKVCEEDYLSQAKDYPTTAYCNLAEEFAQCLLDIAECDPVNVRETVIPTLEDTVNSLGYNCVLLQEDLGDSISGGDTHETEKPYMGNEGAASVACLLKTQSCSERFTYSALISPAFELCGLVTEYVSCMYAISECRVSFIDDQINKEVGSSLVACENREPEANGQTSLRDRLFGDTSLLILMALCWMRSLHAQM